MARWQSINGAKTKGYINMDAPTADRFLNAFNNLTKKLRGSAVDTQRLRKLVDEHGLKERDLLFLCQFLLQFGGWARGSARPEDLGAVEKELGNRLIYALSAAGYAEATIRIMSHAYASSETRPAVLRTGDAAAVRGRLQKLVREGNNFRAMVLEGKLAERLGDRDHAIQLWWQAMDEAVAAANWRSAQRAEGIIPDIAVSATDITELSSPWIELIRALFDRNKVLPPNDPRQERYWKEFQDVLDIGLEQDDPTMFYYAATYYKQYNERGEFTPTSKWLYCMTKAATSGIPKAAHELGVYYAESGWPYIEDEPPDRVKPTPFDRYPGLGRSESVWETLANLFSKAGKIPQHVSEQENLFHTATFPSTAKDRMDLAMRWLDVAMSYQYAPAYLEKAKLYLTKTLWHASDAPDEALTMSPNRLLYKTRSEKEWADYSESDPREWQFPADAKDSPNPYYSEEKAKECLREVFNAYSAIAVRQRAIAKATQASKGSRYLSRGNGLSIEDLENDFNVGTSEDPSQAQEILKFWKYNEVLQYWASDAGRLRQEAMTLCEQREWDLWDERGALLYRSGVGAVKREADTKDFMFQRHS